MQRFPRPELSTRAVGSGDGPPTVFSATMRHSGVGLAGLVLSVVGCAGAGKPAEAVRPQAIAYDTEGCSAEPLVVDLQPEQRGDLEIAMREGVVAVRYDCRAPLRVLRDCRLGGDYGFKGMQTKHKLVRIENTDDLRVNLPTLAVLHAAQLKGELDRGATLDIALVMVGQHRTTFAGPAREGLPPSCAEATHIIKGATVGAFVMKQGTRARVATVAELFGAGASAASASNKAVENQDGSLDACGRAAPDAQSPPQQCAAPLRLILLPIGQGAPAVVTAAPPQGKFQGTIQSVASACPPGFVRIDEMCARPRADAAHTCAPSDAADCAAQCARGDAGSCVNEGVLAAAASDFPRATARFQTACASGSAQGCEMAGYVLADSGNVVGGLALLQRACDGGRSGACKIAGIVYQFGAEGVAPDAAKAARYAQQSCDGGDQQGCTNYGFYLTTGRGVPLDRARAAALFKRACDGNEPTGCNNFGYALDTGKVLPRDRKAAAAYYLKSCQGHATIGCANLATMFQTGVQFGGGDGIPVDHARATQLLELGYAGDTPSLAGSLLNVLYGQSRTFSQQEAMRILSTGIDGCKAGEGRNCGMLAVVAAALGEPGRSPALAQLGCQHGDEWSCALAQRFRAGAAPQPAPTPTPMPMPQPDDDDGPAY